MVLKGSVGAFKYYSESNHFGIFVLDTDEVEEGNIVVKGNVFGISEGDYIEVTGEETDHPLYGHQIKMTSFKAVQPSDSDSVIKYLASGALRGIGPKMAIRIFTKFGEKTLDILENEPERLAEVKGISENIARNIAMEYASKKDIREAMMFMQKYNISNTMAAKIYERYKDKIYDIVTKHPYRIATDIQGIGFIKADEIAKNVGLAENDEERVDAGIKYCLLTAKEDGHTYLPKEELSDKAFTLLNVDREYIVDRISDMCLNNQLVIKKPDRVFLKTSYRAESYCAGKLKTLKDSFEEIIETEEDRDRFARKLEVLMSHYDFELDESQKDAIEKGINNGIFLLTGGPGTGKTTIIKALIEYFYDEDYDVVLCAPTGRAAKRMSEATGFEAKTLHRLLEAQTSREDSDKTAFMKNENNLLEADVFIIDEMSMVDIFLFEAFLKAVPIGSRVIFAGDANQLPSVGPGNVFSDLLSSGFFEKAILNKIHRQSENSKIVLNAHMVNNGECPPLDKNAENDDFFFLERNDKRLLMRDMLELVKKRIPGKFNIAPLDVQILCPSRKGDLGVENLNVIFQKYLNPESPTKSELKRGDTIFRVGDKVMQIKNNYDIIWSIEGKNRIRVEEGRGVFNGDVGIITEIDRFDKSITVKYDNIKIVRYSKDEIDEIDLAYVVTVHKSQGSEYPAVIIPILDTPAQLLNRNLFYTAITRATDCVMIMGDSKKVEEMVKNDFRRRRYTDFLERLNEVMAYID